MKLKLVNHGSNVSDHQRLKMMPQEVRDPDRPDSTLMVEPLEGAPRVTVDRLPVIELVSSSWPMDEVKVEIVKAEVSKGLLKGIQGPVVAALRVPELACDEELFSRDACLPDPEGYPLAHRALVAIDSRAIDVAIAHLDGTAHGLNRLLAARRLPRAESNAGDAPAVGKHKRICQSVHLYLRCSSTHPPEKSIVCPEDTGRRNHNRVETAQLTCHLVRDGTCEGVSAFFSCSYAKVRASMICVSTTSLSTTSPGTLRDSSMVRLEMICMVGPRRSIEAIFRL